MAEVWFYHLERTGPEQVVPELLRKALDAGKSVYLACPDDQRLEFWDEHLWVFEPESWLPHGRDNRAEAEHQPIRLGCKLEFVDNMQILMLVDGADCWDRPEKLTGFERILDFFDGRNESAKEAARARWRLAKAENHSLSYWTQKSTGGWEKSA